MAYVDQEGELSAGNTVYQEGERRSRRDPGGEPRDRLTGVSDPVQLQGTDQQKKLRDLSDGERIPLAAEAWSNWVES